MHTNLLKKRLDAQTEVLAKKLGLPLPSQKLAGTVSKFDQKTEDAEVAKIRARNADFLRAGGLPADALQSSSAHPLVQK